MATTSISTTTLDFLKELKKNNNREWFQTNKDRYKTAQENMKAFSNALVDRMSEYDEIESIKLFRIYRDVRFSKDKTPYKTGLSGGMKRATKWKRGGYYFNIEPGDSIIAGGFWAPNSPDLKRVRAEIAQDAASFRKIITAPTFIKTFGELQGDQVKSAPKGYKKDHPAIDLLRYKQYLVYHNCTDEEITSIDFLDKMVQVYRAMRPFFDYMSSVLTTDLNGVPIE